MTAEGPEEQPPAPTPVVPPDLRLRGERPRVTRLSRKVLIGLGAVSALAVAGALGYALQTRNAAQTRPGAAQHAEPSLRRGPRRPAEGLYRPAAPGAPARAAAARRSRQADPQRRGCAEHRSVPATTPDPEAQRRAQEIEAARLSRLFAQTNQQPQPVGLAAPAATGTHGGSDAHAAGRRRRRAEHAGPQDGLPQCFDGQAHGQSRPARRQGLALCRAGRHRDSRRAHHRHPLRSARPDHRPGDGGGL